ncbi:hypothetical protein CLLI_13700 [Clostridium liquoris]|jgi:formylmethanofuran dehydrogenase subunit E|uniref:Uncharacterized protein n=1 Tax=Clostridium liquoris TaxID=1289519 RepID=A0A2T0B4G9_9CLOT|nr:CD1247 N-terminal domain-containing protein [Clostridium liquoris]PRR78788.1 hypothetical protein CLLI_13700 [Clostridium liquoris]
MDSLKSKISYLSGLIDGLGLEAEGKEGRIITEIVGILEQMADEIEEVQDSQNDMQEHIDALDEDLTSVEDDLYDEDDYDDDYDDENIEDFIDMTCDNCGETVYVDTAILKGKDSITCPNCHKDIPLHFNCGCDCDDCDDCE